MSSTLNTAIMPTISQLIVGQAKTPIIIIDNAYPNPNELLLGAQQASFGANGQFYPGVRSLAPESYRAWLLPLFVQKCLPLMNVAPARAGLTLCHYSIVTTPPEQLQPEQCVPHVDGCHPLKFAAVHYLFLSEHGGTAFYRHRSTEIERVSEEDHNRFFSLRTQELLADNKPPAYIIGDTERYKKIGEVSGAFNRLILYPQNLLHSGIINQPFKVPSTLSDARLSINSFITVDG